MKILILGANGNLGSQLVKVFSSNDHNEVIAWGRENVDIKDRDLVHKKVTELKPGIIINAAAYNAVDLIEESEEEFVRAKLINGEAVANLAEAALENEAVFVNFSTDYVFDGQKKEGYIESDEPKPISRYGKSKLLGERAILKLSSKGLKYYLVRTSKLFGPKGIGETSKPSFFDLMLELSQGKKEFNMIDGEEISCFTYTLDLAKTLEILIKEEKPYGIYHIVNSGRASWYQGVKYLFKIKNITDIRLIPSKTSDYPRTAKRPKYSVLLNKKLPALRGWQEALREYLNKGD